MTGRAPESLKTGLLPVARSDARLLVLGSLPGDASLAARQYYAHPRNQFWSLVSHAIGKDLAPMAYQDRLLCLQECGIAMWDTVRSARRDGSLDSKVRIESVADVAGLIAALPLLRAVAFNGKLAARTGLRIDLPSRLVRLDLPSSSPAYTAPLAIKQTAWDAIARYL